MTTGDSPTHECDSPTGNNIGEKVHQFPGILFGGEEEVNTIRGLLDPGGLRVGSVLQQQLLQVEERLLMGALQDKQSGCVSEWVGDLLMHCNTDRVGSQYNTMHAM